MAGKGDVFLAVGEVAARGDAQLLLHEVQAGDRLGNGMLHLQARVHFDEIELAVLVEELDGADTFVAQRLHGHRNAVADLVALVRIEGGRVRLFPDLLVAALQRAVALAQVNGAALAVAQHLDLDVARLLEVLLDIDIAIAESGLRLRLGRAHGEFEIGLGASHLHAAPAAAGSGLDDDRIADVGGHAARFRKVRDAAFRARNHRDAKILGRELGGDLVAHDADVFRRGADELHAMLGEDVGKAGVLGEETVARMDSLGPGDLAGRDDGRNVEVAVTRRRRPDAHALVGEAHVHCVGVGGGVNGDRLDAEFAAGAQHPERNLAPVCDENFVEHDLLDRHEGLAVFDRPAVLDVDVGDLPAARRMDLVHRLHRFDDEEGLALLHGGADVDEVCSTWRPVRDRPCRPWATSRCRDDRRPWPWRRPLSAAGAT